MPPRHPTYDDTRRRLASGETSVLQTVGEYLQAAGRGSRLNAFVTLLEERALERATIVDRSLADGTAGPLAGMVAAVKDVLCMKGERTTCGSRILENFVAPYDATAVRRLEEAGAVVIGKTNMDEFAMGSSNENSAFGPVLNPLDETRVPGGSSGGSCVSVAAGMAHAALGTDTGGSIRQPAAFCGIVGLKPTYGRVSRYGLVALSSSFDQIGPFANSVADAARVLGAIAGKDACDSTSADVPVPDYLGGLRGGVRGLKVGVPPEALGDGLQREVRERFAECIDSLRARGAEILEVPLPTARYHIAAYYILMTAEASSNLARYDGARYGRRSEAASDLASMYELSRGEGFGAEVKRRIMLGTYVLSAGYYDAYYRKAQKVRRLIREDFLAAFRTVDCMLTPTTPTTAFRFGEKTEDPLQMYLSDVFTVSANLAGIPAISVPFGADDAGMPVGVQLMGRPFDEATLLRAAETLYPSPAPDGEGETEAPARTGH